MAKMRQELDKLKVNLEKEQEQCKNVMNQFATEKSRQKVQFDRSNPELRQMSKSNPFHSYPRLSQFLMEPLGFFK